MGTLAFKNALRLHLDSITMFKAKSYPSAFFLSVIALEELGKTFILEDMFWHSSVDSRMTKDEEEKFINFIYYHRTKQNWFVSEDFDHSKNKAQKMLIKNGKMEKLKQESIYVGLKQSHNKKVNLNSRINDPHKFNKNKAEKQITFINDFLLEFTLGILKKVYSSDLAGVEEYVDKRLFKKIESSWSIIGCKTKTKLKKINNA